MITASVFLILPFCLAIAAISDLLTMTIPNRISLILFSAFLIVAPLTGMGWSSVGTSILAGLLVFVVCFVFFSLNVMGGGDAKLITASAIWFGLDSSLAVYVINLALIGGILTLTILLLRLGSQRVIASGLPLPDSLLVEKKIPYGIAIAIAGLLTYPEAPIVQATIRSIL